MKFILAIIVVTMLSPFTKIHAFEFLTKSDILKKQKVKAFAGEVRNSILVIDDAYKKIEVNNFSQITSSGISKINGPRVNGKLRGCGGDTELSGFRIDSKSPPIVFMNYNHKLSVKWMPAKKLEKLACVKKFADEKSLKIFSIEENQTPFYFLAWPEKKYTQDIAKKDCTFFTQNSQSVNIDNDCVSKYLKKFKTRKHFQAGVVNNPNSDCSINFIKEEITDLDGKNSIDSSMEDLLGLLRIQAEGQIENWLIFNSPGYEGDGIMAIPQDQFEKGNFKNAEWLVYNGC